jgi:hypothetical protein
VGPSGSACRERILRGVSCTCGVSVAGRWPFPRPPSPCSVAGVAFEGFRRARLTIASGGERPLVVFAPLQSSILSPWPDNRPPLVGFVSPLHRRAPGRLLPPRRPRGRLGFGSMAARPGHPVPSSRCCTASTAFSALIRAPERSNRGVAGLLHPAADPGVRRVSGHPLRPTVAGVPERRLSRDAFRTPRRIPLVRSRTVSPRPWPPCRSPERSDPLPGHPFPGVPVHAPSCSDADFEALLRRRVRNVSAPLPARHALSFRWALFPFKVCFDVEVRPCLPRPWRPEASEEARSTTSSAPHPSGPHRAGGCPPCDGDAGDPRERESCTWKLQPPKRPGQATVTHRSALVSPRLGRRHRSAAVGSRAGRNRRGRAATTRSLRSSPRRQVRPCPPPGAQPKPGGRDAASMLPSPRVSAAGVYPEPKFTPLARRGPSWGS